MSTAHTLTWRFFAASLAGLFALGTAPADDPGWNNVSIRGNGTAVYLGNGCVLTANHTTGGDMTFNGQTFSEARRCS